MRTPSILDWLPQFRQQQRYHDLAFRPLAALVDAEGYRPVWAVVPRTSHPALSAGAIAARGALEDQVTIRAGSFLWGFSSSSAEAAGFRFDVWDQSRGKRQLVSGVNNGVLAGTSVAPFSQNGPSFLPQLYPFPEAGLLSIRLVNLATVANAVQLALLLAEPVGGGEL